MYLYKIRYKYYIIPIPNQESLIPVIFNLNHLFFIQIFFHIIYLL